MIRPNFTGRGLRLAALFVCLLSGGLVSLHAQVPSPEQLETFQSLSPDQQQRILETMGGGGTPSTGEAPRSRPDRRVVFPDLMRRDAADLEEDQQLAELMGQEREPRFKSGDTLLLSLEVREFSGQELLAAPEAAKPTGAMPNVATSPVKSSSPAASGGDKIVRTDAERARLNDLRTRILRRNPLGLDKWGVLNIPELGPIPLAGLTVEEAQKRLAAEPLLMDFMVGVTYLPVKPVGAGALEPFGYDLFRGVPSTFAPATDVPVPAEYVVGPGDVIEIQLIGNNKARSGLVVGRDGRVNFPELGPIAVGGMRFNEVRAMIERRVANEMIGSQVNVQLGELRSIRIFVLGDAKRPGSYTVSGLSTITNALFLSGGVKKIGSLRNIELKRNGQTVSRLDLYDLLLKGDTHADVRLLPGDVIFIPTVGRMVGVGGEVRRPALYELKAEATAADLIALAGGLTAEADAKLATLDRVDAERKRIVLDMDMTTSASTLALRNGDMLNVPTVRPLIEGSVKLSGHVHRAGTFQFRPGMRLSDVISSIDELKPSADKHYLLIRREVPPNRKVQFVSADLVKALAQRGSSADIALTPRDEIHVFDLETGRDRVMEPLLRELRLQSSYDEPTAEVGISGRVNIPGQYPLEPGMRVGDLVRAGGSLSEAAYGGKAELTRNVVVNGEERQTELIEIDLAKAMAGDPADNIELHPYDYLVIKELPLWGGQEYVQIEGEVKFPGRYPIQRGETLRSVIGRAGGLTDLAFAAGTVFTREGLKRREREQLDNMVKRMQTDLAQVSLMAAQESGGNGAQALAVGNQLLENLRSAAPVGRLVIDMGKSAATPAKQEIILKNGDRLIVPRVTQEVTVIGEVQSPTSHLFVAGSSPDDYIDLSGGTTQRADKSRIYVVRADGSVVGGHGNSWFSGRGIDIRPGDTVVVPLDAERMRSLPLWTAVTTIIYNLAIAVAAVNSF